ncbi:MAG TPA: hypothetical protein VG298_07455 [Acidimicrobiales bacterium]|nr:hypothetical protein [Acidimicrobiales bacterium]
MVATGTLPSIDEHQVQVDVPPDQLWAALLSTFTGLTTHAGWRVLARALGCQPDSASGDPDTPETCLPGFRVRRSEPPREWALEGKHRFSSYALTFRITALDGGHCLLSAESSAAFPGPLGMMYRTLVIGTGGHVLTVHSMLKRIKGKAERSQPPEAA